MNNQSLTISLILAAIEDSVLKLLEMDAGTQNRISGLPDSTLKVNLKGFDFSFFVTVMQGKVSLNSYSEESCTCILACYPTDLISLFSRSEDGVPILNPKATVEGNQQILVELYEIFSQAEPDYEAEISRLLGPVIAHETGRAFRTGARWLDETKDSVLTNLKLFLREEVTLIPHPVELENFYAEVSELEQRVARLSLSVEQLTISTENTSTSSSNDSTSSSTTTVAPNRDSDTPPGDAS
jgi:ubiquinone biosynthesis protein UbiJ